MARGVVVLDNRFGLPMTSGGVGVLGAGSLPPVMRCKRLHHPLESLAVEGGVVAVPGSDSARQDALNYASVKVCEGFR